MKTYHFYLKGRTLAKPGVYPEYMKENENYFRHSQKVFESPYVTDPSTIKEDLADMTKEVRDILLSDNLDFLKYAVFDKYQINHIVPSSYDVVKELIRNIPVYLVSSKFEGNGITETTVLNDFRKCPCCGNDMLILNQGAHAIPEDKLLSYDIRLEDLKKRIEKKSFEELRPSTMNQLLGLYEMDQPEGNFVLMTEADLTIQKISQSRRIFLWIDNIVEAAEKSGCDYKNLYFLVLCHEFMHAIMDVYNAKNLRIKGANPNETKIFETFKEESLANGFALYLFKLKFTRPDEHMGIRNFVKSQFLPYQFGLLFQDKPILKKEVPEWMSIKLGQKSLSKKKIYDWFSRCIGEMEKLNL